MENKSHVPKHRSLIIHDYLYIVTMTYKTPTRKGLKNALPLKTHDVSHGFPTVFPSCFPRFSHGFPDAGISGGIGLHPAQLQHLLQELQKTWSEVTAAGDQFLFGDRTGSSVGSSVGKKRPEAETCADYALTIFNYV